MDDETRSGNAGLTWCEKSGTLLSGPIIKMSADVPTMVQWRSHIRQRSLLDSNYSRGRDFYAGTLTLDFYVIQLAFDC